MRRASLAEIDAAARTIARPADGSTACCVVENGSYRAAWARDAGRRMEPVGPALDHPRDAARLADLLNGRVPA